MAGSVQAEHSDLTDAQKTLDSAVDGALDQKMVIGESPEDFAKAFLVDVDHFVKDLLASDANEDIQAEQMKSLRVIIEDTGAENIAAKAEEILSKINIFRLADGISEEDAVVMPLSEAVESGDSHFAEKSLLSAIAKEEFGVDWEVDPFKAFAVVKIINDLLADGRNPNTPITSAEAERGFKKEDIQTKIAALDADQINKSLEWYREQGGTKSGWVDSLEAKAKDIAAGRTVAVNEQRSLDLIQPGESVPQDEAASLGIVEEGTNNVLIRGWAFDRGNKVAIKLPLVSYATVEQYDAALRKVLPPNAAINVDDAEAMGIIQNGVSISGWEFTDDNKNVYMLPRA